MARLAFILGLAWCCSAGLGAEPFSKWRDVLTFDPVIYDFDLGNFTWTAGKPLIDVPERPGDTVYAVKEPTVVKVNDRWHLFCVTRSAQHSHQVEYLTVSDWKQAGAAQRRVLELGGGDFSSPQIFFYTPQNQWYLILQAPDPANPAEMLPYFSTNSDIARPEGWSKPAPMIDRTPEGVRLWRDFWVICDDTSAYLFAASRDGRLWRTETTLEDFPRKWGAPLDILKADFMGSPRVYKVQGTGESTYLVTVEAMDVGIRYCKAFTAKYLDQGWSPIPSSVQPPPARRKCLASHLNITFSPGVESWTDSVSHAEILRAGNDELMEIDPHKWRMVFQGTSVDGRRAKGYREVEWRIGMLEYAKPPPPWMRD